MENRTEKTLELLLQSLQKQMGLHRQLLDAVRAEREVIRDADLSKIQELTYSKEGLIESVRGVERDRQRLLAQLALDLRKTPESLTLGLLAIEIQGKLPKIADQLRSAQNALVILVQRIQEQNAYNAKLIASSLEHLVQMKRNVLGESVPRSDTYSQKAQKVPGGTGGSRLISKEV